MNRDFSSDTVKNISSEAVKAITPEDCEIHDVDPHDWLNSPEAIAIYLDEAIASGDAGYLAHCLEQVTQVADMSKVTQTAGLNLQALGKSLSEDVPPRMDTVLAILQALDMRLHVRPAESA